MKISRKDFLKSVAAVPLVVVAGGCLMSEEKRAGRVRHAMAIDVAKCREGCTRCIEACHAAHNVPRTDDAKHEVKWVWKDRFENVFRSESAPEAIKTKSLPVLCNHCENPSCTRVCPTGATWKRDDGIVMMDWHRCIGCRYCMAACAYGSRSFNFDDPRARIASINSEFPTRTKGVVEKCNFCAERLDVGKAPLCVEVCPEKAVVFGDLNDEQSEISRLLRSRFALRRKVELGTGPSVFYAI